MRRAANVLERTYTKYQNFDEAMPAQDPLEKLDRLELLSSRFSRLAYFMIQRIFRLINELDLESAGTVRDIINRAEKKELIADADSFVEICILRKNIAHEYVEEVMMQIYQEVIRVVPQVLDSVERVEKYILRYQMPKEMP